MVPIVHLGVYFFNFVTDMLTDQVPGDLNCHTILVTANWGNYKLFITNLTIPTPAVAKMAKSVASILPYLPTCWQQRGLTMGGVLSKKEM